jgi:branched-subunit amino acid transport protein
MSAIDVWTGIGLLLLATLGTRASFFIMGKAGRLPPRVQHALSFSPAVALAAILAPDLLLVDGNHMVSLTEPKLLAGLSAAAFFLLTRHMLATILFGMAVLTVLRLTA